MNRDVFEPLPTVSVEEISQSIPKEATTKPKKGWQKLGMVEWRWRFLTLPVGRRVVEISRLYPFLTKREYINAEGRWKSQSVDPVYDNYVDIEYYYYSCITSFH